MKTKKQLLPFLCVLALSFLASKPFFDKNVGPLSLIYPKESLIQSDDEEGWSIIRYKIFFPNDPPKETLADLAKQEELLASYGE